MRRRHLTFECEGSTLVGTLDKASGASGLLLVSGGNEVRGGAWNGQALLAARIAAEGFPVFRFDRRGVGDSAGGNGGFRTSAPDIAAAMAAFRAACPQMTRVVGLGNCDAASALMLAKGAECDALVLSNPWTIEESGDDGGEAAAPPEVVRDHYRRRMSDPRAILRLLTGKVSLGKLVSSLLGALRPAPPPGTLATEMAAGIAKFRGTVIFPVAERDRTAQAFLAAWNRKDARIRRCADATHSFVEAPAREWYAQQILDVLRG